MINRVSDWLNLVPEGGELTPVHETCRLLIPKSPESLKSQKATSSGRRRAQMRGLKSRTDAEEFEIYLISHRLLRAVVNGPGEEQPRWLSAGGQNVKDPVFAS
jgi:hypothetical protein